MPYAGPIQHKARQTHDLKRLGYPEIPMLGAYLNTSSKAGLETHFHPGIMEICYLVSGKQNYHVDGQDYVMGGNDLFVTFPDEAHSSGNAPEGKGMLFWLQVKLPKHGQGFLGLNAAASRVLALELRGLPIRHFRGEVKLKRMFEDILDLMHPCDELMRLQVGIRIIDWLLLVIHCARRTMAGVVCPQLSRDVRRVCEALATDPARDWSIEEMAGLAGLSISRFKAKFKLQVGAPPREYLLRNRIDLARDRLRNGSESITDLAYQLGFSSSQYFATVYKKYTMHRPSDERTGSR